MMDTMMNDTKCPFCNLHPPEGVANYKVRYCADCGDRTEEVVRKDQDKNFVCPACNDLMLNENHMRHFIISVPAYLV